MRTMTPMKRYSSIATALMVLNHSEGECFVLTDYRLHQPDNRTEIITDYHF